MLYDEKQNYLKSFVGSKIETIQMNVAKTYIRFKTDKGIFNFTAVGDCCSTSWIEHMNGVSLVVGGTVTELPDLNPYAFEVQNNMEEYACLQKYITTIKTDKGQLDIEFRNDSNGYYSGFLSLEGSSEPKTLKLVKGDF